MPWNKLSTQPIEVTLSKVYLVLAPIKKEKWSFQDFKSLQAKTENLEKFFENYIQQVITIEIVRFLSSSFDRDLN